MARAAWIDQPSSEGLATAAVPSTSGGGDQRGCAGAGAGAGVLGCVDVDVDVETGVGIGVYVGAGVVVGGAGVVVDVGAQPSCSSERLKAC